VTISASFAGNRAKRVRTLSDGPLHRAELRAKPHLFPTHAIKKFAIISGIFHPQVFLRSDSSPCQKSTIRQSDFVKLFQDASCFKLTDWFANPIVRSVLGHSFDPSDIFSSRSEVGDICQPFSKGKNLSLQTRYLNFYLAKYARRNGTSNMDTASA
jgi:hypothetical protein